MFTHSVYFWLRDDLTTEQIEQVDAGIASLLTIETVRQGFIGKPASTDRPVIDTTYSRCLIATFDDLAGHDVYQDHPVHDKFRDDCHEMWSKVQIYDAVSD